MAITDSEPQATGHWRWYLLGGGVVVLAPVLFLAFGTKPHSNVPGKDKPTENHRESARQSLSRDTDIDTCRSALADFNAYLAKSETRRVQPLTEQQRVALRERFDLDGGELAEVDADTFTQLDGPYLELCFLLHDAAAALDVETGGRPEGRQRPAPLRQAEAAFGWAVRQVRVDRTEGPPLPPQFVLRRGSGSPLERALVFLELLRHVGADDERLTGCLVFCPDRDGDMRLWACGVLVNDKPDVYLFDPRLGLPLPGPKGEGVATLAAAAQNADVLGQLRPHRYDVTPEQAANAELRYVSSLTAMAPRMRLLQDELLKSVANVRFAVVAEDEVRRLTTAAQAQPGTKPAVRAWQDGKATGAGVLRRFLPPEDGGVQANSFIKRDFVLALVPWPSMPRDFLDEQKFPPRVGLGLRVRNFFGAPFIEMALEPHHARDELLRGHYNKALNELVQTRTLCRNAEDRLNQLSKDADALVEVEKWHDEAVAAYAKQQRAAGNPEELAEAKAKVEAVWRESRTVHVLLDGTRSWPLRLEVLFQLALGKHEQAERLEMQHELNPKDETLAERAVDAWKEAVNWWQRYLSEYRAAKSYAVQLEQIRARRDRRLYAEESNLNAAVNAAQLAGTAPGAAVRMLGRSQWLSGDRSGAQQTWGQDVPISSLEKVGNQYLSRKGQR